MSSLILKDLYTQTKYIGLILSLYLIFTFVPGLPGEVFMSMGIIMVAFRLAFIEDKNNTLSLLRTMPLKPATIVMSKFISELIIALVFILVSAIHLTGLTGRGVEGFLSGIMAVSVILLFAGVTFALSFRLGYLKASSYVRILFLLCFAPFFFPGIVSKIQLVLTRLAEHIPMTWVTGVVAEILLIGIYFIIGGLATLLFKGRKEL